MVIAIDGPAGVGKSTIAKMIAQKGGLYYLNSGNFYRAVTLKHLQTGGDFNDREACIHTAQTADISIVDGHFLLDGQCVDDKLHNSGVDMNASRISCIPEVREAVNRRINAVCKGMDIICEGRDMTTVVFPDAEFKFYFDAEPEVRARRRYLQNPGEGTFEEVLRSIRERDENDRNKPVGALKIAPGAHIIDTSYLTITEVCEKVLSVVKAAKF
ncbi:MAG: (d)CMP kinase [Spirochaetales bacterium]|nr:(d)CMP kinase [Spirochaetales bacterium]